MPINNLIYRENLDIELGGELLVTPELSHLKIASKKVLDPPPMLCRCNEIGIATNCYFCIYCHKSCPLLCTIL